MTRFQTVSLALIVGLILVLSGIMDRAGQMQRLVERFTSLLMSAAVIPPGILRISRQGGG